MARLYIASQCPSPGDSESVPLAPRFHGRLHRPARTAALANPGPKDCIPWNPAQPCAARMPPKPAALDWQLMVPCPPIPPRPESGGFCSGFAPQNRRTHATPDSSLSLSLKTAAFRSLALMLWLRCQATATLRAFHLRDTDSAPPRPGCDVSKKPASRNRGIYGMAPASFRAVPPGMVGTVTG